MADPVVARTTQTYAPIPEGEYQAVCVDVIDLGRHLNEQYAQIQPKVALIFQLVDEHGARHELAEWFTVSMGDKARLRAFLEQWRGRRYTPEQLAAGVPLDKLTGQNAYITVRHNRVNDKVFANAFNIRPLGKRDPAITATGYTRAPYWETVRAKAIPEDPSPEPDTDDGLPAEDDSDLAF